MILNGNKEACDERMKSNLNAVHCNTFRIPTKNFIGIATFDAFWQIAQIVSKIVLTRETHIDKDAFVMLNTVKPTDIFFPFDAFVHNF